jgi:hypothetical protein
MVLMPAPPFDADRARYIPEADHHKATLLLTVARVRGGPDHPIGGSELLVAALPSDIPRHGAPDNSLS